MEVGIETEEDSLLGTKVVEEAGVGVVHAIFEQYLPSIPLL